jgi:hypothetical protein
MNKLKAFIVIGFSSAVLISCNQSAKSTADRDNKDSTTTLKASNVVLKDDRINAAYKDYTAVKDALVASNPTMAQKAATSLSNSLKGIQGCQNTAGIAAKIASSAKLDEQRANFTLVSADFIPLLKHADVQQGSLYVEFCPMANSRKGGYWIASSKEIRNPYYGDDMLNCGEVKDSITTVPKGQGNL